MSKPAAKDTYKFIQRGKFSSAVFIIIAVVVGSIIYALWQTQDGTIKSGSHTRVSSERMELIILSAMALLLGVASFLYFCAALKMKRLRFLERDDAQHSKDELLSLASHQLRTPATAVKQYIGMILEGYIGEITDEQYKILKKAYSSNERQIHTINQILYVTKADAGRLELQKSYFNLNQLIEEVISDMSEVIIKERHQKIVFEPRYVNMPIFADKHCIRMVVENLLTNASKYTHTNGMIHIKTDRRDDMAVLSVADNGVGIRFEDRDKLFKKFSRIDNELSIQAGGSGIGLFLDKILVELHGGRIKVASLPQEGTTFSVYLPFKHAKGGHPVA